MNSHGYYYNLVRISDRQVFISNSLEFLTCYISKEIEHYKLLMWYSLDLQLFPLFPTAEEWILLMVIAFSNMPYV